MKKNDLKKLQLSRETLRVLTRSDVQKVIGGDPSSAQSQCPGPCPATGDPSTDTNC
jgi:hypothetical protein